MTTQSQVEEQLIAEWLSLKGYFIETNIGLSAHKKGGRGEADIVAVKLENNQLIIRHIEVGGLSRKFEDNLSDVRKKFKESNRIDIEEFVKKRISHSGNLDADYRCEYMSYISPKKATEYTEALEDDGITVISLRSILRDEIHDTIKAWKQGEVQSKRLTGKDWTYVQLPRKYRILYILDIMRSLLVEV